MPGSIISLSGATTHDDAITARNLAGAATIEDLISITPKAFAPRFGPLFRKLADLAVKTSHVKATVANLTAHYANGTLPPQFLGSLKVPTVQTTKEYDGTENKITKVKEMTDAVKEVQIKTLDLAIKLKKGELEHLENLIGKDSLKAQSVAAVKDTEDVIGTTFVVGTNDRGGPCYASFYVQELNFIRTRGTDLCQKAIAIGYAKHHREMVTKISKLKIKKDTDVDMANMPVNDVKKQIDLAVREAMKKQASNKKNSSEKKNKQKSPTDSKKRPAKVQKGNAKGKENKRHKKK